MDEEQVKAAIADALKSFKDEIASMVDDKGMGLASSVSKQVKKQAEAMNQMIADLQKPADEAGKDTPAASEEQSLAMKALQTQLGELQTQLADEKATAYRSASTSALTTAIADAKAENPTALRKLLTSEYGQNLKQEDGKWFVADGDSATPLNEAIAAYLKTPEGKYFVAPSGIQGSSSTESAIAPNSGTSEKKDLAGMLGEIAAGTATLKLN